MRRIGLLVVLLAGFWWSALAEESHAVVHHLGVTAGIDYVPSSLDDEIREENLGKEMIMVNSAVPLNLRYSFSFTDPDIPHFLPGGYQGVAVGVLNLGAAQPRGLSKSTRNIGYPVFAYIFQGGPFHHFSERLSLGYEWNFGAAFGWKPYSQSNKNFNLIVGSRVNAYLNVNLLLNWKVNPHTTLFGGVALSHLSNGNTSFPNPGVNYLGLRVGMEWTLNPQPEKTDTLPTLKSDKRKLEYDISAWGSTRKRLYRGMEPPVLLPGHYACAGVTFAPMYRLNRWWRVGGGLDLQWDRSSNMKRHYISGNTTGDIRFSTPSFWSQASVGLSAHAELRMPIFAVNIGCGYNLVAPPENRHSYQNITLKAYIIENLFLNVGYQLRNFKQQGCLMLGSGVTL